MTKKKHQDPQAHAALARQNLEATFTHLERWTRETPPSSRSEPRTEAGQCFRRVTDILTRRREAYSHSVRFGAKRG